MTDEEMALRKKEIKIIEIANDIHKYLLGRQEINKIACAEEQEWHEISEFIWAVREKENEMREKIKQQLEHIHD